ncbi:MAG: DHH family phosphoesterase [bacterium]
MSDIAKEIMECIMKAHSFLITSHEAGDGDSVGSQLALALILRRMEKDVLVLNKDPVPKIYDFLPGVEEIQTQTKRDLEEFEVIFILDCGSMERTAISIPKRGMIINIDHHLNNTQFGRLNWVRPDMSSTAEIIYTLGQTLSIPMDRSIGDNLYTGMLTDTGSFRYSNTSSQCLQAASRLIEAGVSPSYIARQVYERKSLSQLLLLGAALSTMKLTDDQKIAHMYLNREMLETCGATLADTEEMVNYPMSITSVEVALFFKEISKNFFKISLRSKGRVNVAAVAEAFDGGGHYNAAGAKVKGDFTTILKQIIEAVYDQSAF